MYSRHTLCMYVQYKCSYVSYVCVCVYIRYILCMYNVQYFISVTVNHSGHVKADINTSFPVLRVYKTLPHSTCLHLTATEH